MSHVEDHKIHRVGWMRAAVLGANDGIVSTASLIVGVAAAGVAHGDILLAGIAGVVAGAMSMAAGEYVSVSSQADTENADMEMEKNSILDDYAAELEELAKIYEARGVEPLLAEKVAGQLMSHDALAAHARDELGIFEHIKARPIQAALSSAATFSAGAALPLIATWLVAGKQLIPTVAAIALLGLALLGGLAAKTGGASVVKGASRVTFWGVLAMLMTAAVGYVFGVGA
ncbi:MAG: VIT family protein [Spongiibacteraceae bacterium]